MFLGRVIFVVTLTLMIKTKLIADDCNDDNVYKQADHL